MLKNSLMQCYQGFLNLFHNVLIFEGLNFPVKKIFS